jgi:DNA-binding MurR/RpiR family transcriptional regulator
MKPKDAFQYIQAIRAWRFTANEKIVAIMLSSRYNWTKMACAWPSNKLIAEDTGLSVSAVVKAKKKLVEDGFLQIQRQFNNSCKYTPMLPDNIGVVMENYTSAFKDDSYAPKANLKDNIKENIKEKLQHDSNESLVLSNISIKEGITNIQEESSDNPSLAEVRAIAAEDYWKVFESR